MKGKIPNIIWHEAHQELIDLERALTAVANDMWFPPMYTKCLDCNTSGNCFPYDRRCGNCNSLNTTRYYSEGAINELLRGRPARGGGQSICNAPIDPGGIPEGGNAEALAEQKNAAVWQGRLGNGPWQTLRSEPHGNGVENVEVGLAETLKRRN